MAIEGATAIRRFERLQALRYLAAAAVVGFHARGAAIAYLGRDSAIISPLAHGGFGVDLFFVLSGFIIHYTASTREASPAKFLRRRVERIVPLYWFCTLTLAALGLAIPALSSGQNWANPPHLAQSLTFTSMAWGQSPVVYVGWTLEFEMLFYLLATLGLAALSERYRWRALVCLLSLAAAVGALFPAKWPALAFLTNPIVLEFGFGVAIAEVVMRGKVDRLQVGALATALAVLAATRAPAGQRVLIAGTTALVIVLFVALIDYRRPEVPKPLQPFVLFGDASYSLYLIQVLTVPACAKVVKALAPEMPVELFVVVALIASTAASLLLFFGFEQPTRRFFRAGWPKLRPMSRASTAS